MKLAAGFGRTYPPGMRIASLVVSGLVVGLTVLACGGTGDGNVFVAVTPTTLQALSGTFCNKAAECTSDILINVVYGSADTCRARLLQQLQLGSKGQGYGVSEAGAAACNTALGSASCQDVLNGVVPDACKFTGTLADGTSCSDDAQCASGACFVDPAATCGKCGPRSPLGADCTNSSCERGLKCGSNKKCTDGTAGATCAKDDDCRAFTSCRGGVCVAPLQEGAACTAGDENTPCDLTKALFCQAGTCKKVPLTSVGNGEKCGATSLSPLTIALCTNGECTDDKCVPRAADGTTCTAAADNCQAPAECRNGTCALLDPNVCK